MYTFHKRNVEELPDTDGDGVPDTANNCDSSSNPGQADVDDERLGDARDSSDTLAPPLQSTRHRGGSGKVLVSPLADTYDDK